MFQFKSFFSKVFLKDCSSFLQSILFLHAFVSLSLGWSLCFGTNTLTSTSMCTSQWSLNYYFKVPFISWKRPELSVLPKEFPLGLYWLVKRPGACQKALWSATSWRLCSYPIMSTKQCPCLVELCQLMGILAASLSSLPLYSSWLSYHPSFILSYVVMLANLRICLLKIFEAWLASHYSIINLTGVWVTLCYCWICGLNC